LKHSHLALIIAAALAALSTGAQASGYRFGSQSVSGQGYADANGAEAADPSTIFYNPAGLSRLSGTQLTGGATMVIPHSTYTDTGSTRFTGTPAGGTAAHDYAPDSVTAPSLYFSRQINDQWTAGVGVFVPYGTKLDFGNSWTGRYALTNVKLEAVTINPSVSFKLNEHHAFGLGIDAEYMKANLDQAVDVPGAVAALSANPVAAGALIRQIAALGGNPAVLAGAKDGHGADDVKDWGYGFNLGYLFTLDEATRFGLAYRSSIVHKLKGGTVWDFSQSTSDPVVNQVLAASSHRANSAAEIDIRTPETLSANVFHQFNSTWAGMADVTFTRNNRMGDIDIQFPGTSEGTEVIRQQWRNTYRLSAGGSYRYNEKLLLRAGVAYDQSPVRSAELTHPALPDSDRYERSLGANWKVSDRGSIDVAYTFMDFKDASSNYTNACTPLTVGCTGNGETTRGIYKTQLQMLGVAYNYKF